MADEKPPRRWRDLTAEERADFIRIARLRASFGFGLMTSCPAEDLPQFGQAFIESSNFFPRRRRGSRE